MERELYRHSFTEENLPDYLCPRCNKGLLRIKDDTLNKIETVSSKQHQLEEYSEFQDIDYTFNCMFECINNKCGEVVACTGHAGVDIEYAVDYDNLSQPNEYYTYYKPLFFYPSLQLIALPKCTPDKVKELLDESFRLFFTSPASSANLVRKSIEEVLNDLNIGMPTIKSNGDKIFTTLDSRINKLTEKFESLRNRFFAIKWLGNAGSHSGDRITADDTMDAYELVEDLLLKIYGSKDDELNMLADQINISKGPKK